MRSVLIYILRELYVHSVVCTLYSNFLEVYYLFSFVCLQFVHLLAVKLVFAATTHSRTHAENHSTVINVHFSDRPELSNVEAVVTRKVHGVGLIIIINNIIIIIIINVNLYSALSSTKKPLMR